MPTYVHMDETGKTTRVVIMADGYRPCMMCDGKGEIVEWGERKTCPDCEGEGMIYEDEDEA